MSTDYSGLSRDELESRCASAEAVCVVFAWTPTTMGSGIDTDDAVMELWTQWHRLVPDSFTSPDVQAALRASVSTLATQRRATRQAVLARFGAQS